MKFSILLFTALTFLASCKSGGGVSREKDSVPAPSKASQIPSVSTVCDTVIDTVFVPSPIDEKISPIRLGRHKLTLQWISWNVPGYVEISKADDEGWYLVKGEQLGKREDQYLRINGVIKPVTGTELLFRGTVEIKVIGSNKGETCVKKGSKLFLTKENRQYWRLQDMLNCDGIATDYVDIYF